MVVCVMTNVIAQRNNVALVLFPAVIKICIGIVQVAVIIEITMRVKESVRMLVVTPVDLVGQVDGNEPFVNVQLGGRLPWRS